MFKRFQHVKKMTNLGFDHLGNPVCQEIDPVRMRQVSAMRSENTLPDLGHLNLYDRQKPAAWREPVMRRFCITGSIEWYNCTALKLLLSLLQFRHWTSNIKHRTSDTRFFYITNCQAVRLSSRRSLYLCAISGHFPSSV